MDDFWTLIIGVMVGCGLVGGLANFCRTGEGCKDFGKSVLTAIIASCCVPFFLHMISSNLIDSIKGQDGTSLVMSKLLVFGGFCLIAAYSSEKFLGALTDRIIRELQQARKVANEAKATSAKAQTTANEAKATSAKTETVMDLVVGSMEEPEPESEVRSRAIAPLQGPLEISEDEKKVLEALRNPMYRFRTVTGLAGETKLELSEVKKILNGLMDKGCVGQLKRKTGPRYSITDGGNQYLTTSE